MDNNHKTLHIKVLRIMFMYNMNIAKRDISKVLSVTIRLLYVYTKYAKHGECFPRLFNKVIKFKMPAFSRNRGMAYPLSH